jgi:serine/threonine-protein kinase
MKQNSIHRFVQELKRRRVFRGIAVYGASTLILLEAADNICGAFGIDGTPKWFIWLLGIGFFGSLWFSWIYDITPGGIIKTEPVTPEKVPIPSKKMRTYKLTTFLSVIIIVGLLTFRIAEGVSTNKLDNIEKSIAVLPLTEEDLNLTNLDRFQFIGHEITSRLVNVKDYTVIPWDETRNYIRISPDYALIGEDLSAAILVIWRPYETSVENRLYVDLISANDKKLLWSKSYKISSNWPISEINRCGRKISKKITKKLRTFLTPEERALVNEERLAKASWLMFKGNAVTLDTWGMIQTGKVQNQQPNENYYDSIGFNSAIKYYTEAIEEDSTFARAYANRAKARLWGIRFNYFDKNMLDECRQDIKVAFGLDNNLPEAHLAMGLYYYYGLENHELANEYIQKAIDLRPNDIEYLFYLAKINSSLGNWDKVQPLADKVFEMKPRNALYLTNLGSMYFYLHNYSRSKECQDRAIKLTPEWHGPYINKLLLLIGIGDFIEARAVIQTARITTGMDYNKILAELDFYEGKYASAVENIERVTSSESRDMLDSDGDLYLMKAKIYKHAGDAEQAKKYYELAVNYYMNLVMFNPEAYLAFSNLGIAYAGIGNKQEAIQSGMKAIELLNRKVDAISEPYIEYNLIKIYAMLGENKSAKILLEELMDSNPPFLFEYVKLDPDLKHLFDDSVVQFINP